MWIHQKPPRRYTRSRHGKKSRLDLGLLPLLFFARNQSHLGPGHDMCFLALERFSLLKLGCAVGHGDGLRRNRTFNRFPALLPLFEDRTRSHIGAPIAKS